jgi:hypothetical protein
MPCLGAWMLRTRMLCAWMLGPRMFRPRMPHFGVNALADAIQSRSPLRDREAAATYLQKFAGFGPASRNTSGN